MKRRFKNTKTGHVFFDVHGDGILRSANSRLTYTISEAENSTELTEIYDN